MTRTVKKPDERKQEIISIAAKLFLEKEYEKTTMEDIVKELEIAKGTVYHYFKSKDELLDAVVDSTVESYISDLESVLSKAKGSALERIRMLIQSANVSNEQSEMLQQLHKPGNVALHTRQLAVIFKKMAPLLAQLIDEGCKEGIFKTDFPLEVAEIFLTGIQFLTDSGIYPWTSEEIQRRAKAIPVLIEVQLNAPKGSFDFIMKN